MYNKILVAIALDHSPESGAALDIARRLASEGGQIVALNVVEEIPSYVANELPDDILSSRQSAAEAELKAELGGVQDVKPEVIKGHAGRSIVEYADDRDFDCIIVSSHRPGFQDYFLGSTAQWVVRHSKSSVHVAR